MYRFCHYSLLRRSGTDILENAVHDVLPRTFNLGYSVCPKCRPTLFRCEVAVVAAITVAAAAAV